MKEIIESGWRAAGILDALRLGSSKLPSIDPFEDIDPLLSAPVRDNNEPNVGKPNEFVSQEGFVGESDEDEDE